ncbi:MAG: hypothetical protein QXS69_04035 [Candidatus Aenigmatarchaeota archaeon]
MVMCRNLMFISRKPYGSRIPIYVFEDILESMKYNDDGFALYVKFLKREYQIRTLSLYEYVRTLIRLENENILLLHTHLRAATTGTISVDNVHLWTQNDIMFSHNGYVTKYAKYSCILKGSKVSIRKFFFNINNKKECEEEENNDSDSKQFFYNNVGLLEQSLLEDNVKKLKEICKNEGLYGVIMINDRNGKFIALGLGKPVYLYVFKKNKALIVSNTPMYISNNANEIKCEYVRGHAGEQKFYFKKWKEENIIEVYKNNWYWYDWYT